MTGHIESAGGGKGTCYVCRQTTSLLADVFFQDVFGTRSHLCICERCATTAFLAASEEHPDSGPYTGDPGDEHQGDLFDE